MSNGLLMFGVAACNQPYGFEGLGVDIAVNLAVLPAL
jgi:hypothetical protein